MALCLSPRAPEASRSFVLKGLGVSLGGSEGLVGLTLLFLAGEEDGRDQSRLETKVWEAHNPLIDKQIDQFLVVARWVPSLPWTRRLLLGSWGSSGFERRGLVACPHPVGAGYLQRPSCWAQMGLFLGLDDGRDACPCPDGLWAAVCTQHGGARGS